LTFSGLHNILSLLETVSCFLDPFEDTEMMKDQEDTAPPAYTTEDVEISDLKPPSHPWSRWIRPLHLPRFSKAQQRLSLGATALLFVLVVGFLLNSIVDISGLITDRFFSPQPTVSTVRGQFYLQGNPNWGHFLIDGKTIQHLDVIGIK
jgi:hypothetical protein